MVALQHQADWAVAYVCACLWLWCISTRDCHGSGILMGGHELTRGNAHGY